MNTDIEYCNKYHDDKHRFPGTCAICKQLVKERKVKEGK